MKNGAILSNSEYFSCRNIKKIAVKFLLYICIITNRKALYKSAFFAKDFEGKSGVRAYIGKIF